MQAFVWSPRFETGIASVDQQHQLLVGLVNQVGDLLIQASAASEDKIQEVFHQLADYVRFHFKDEERVMAEAGLDPAFISIHKSHHRDFGEQVLAMWQARKSMQRPAESLHGFLAAWLTFHILGEDQAMARQIRHINAGMAPAAAHTLESESNDTSTTTLLEALSNLYRVLSLQNQDLAATNRELENKVAVRTRELLQAEKMASIGQLAAGIAHEINNPLGFVSSNFGTLEHYVNQLLPLARLGASTPAGQALSFDADLDFVCSDAQELIMESRQGLERVRKIVADLKDFSHVDEVLWQQADLLHEMEKTLSVVGHRLTPHAKLVREMMPLPAVRCIPAQINQVFVNLLLNAVQAIGEQGTITLRSGHDDKQVWIEIMDTGCGMDETTKTRLFEPFFTTRPVGAGIGLGLSVSWDIVQKHGGTLEFTSEPAQGSTFRIRLPIAGPSSSETLP